MEAVDDRTGLQAAGDLFQDLAGQAQTLRSVLGAAARAEGDEAADLLDAARLLVERIGLAADDAARACGTGGLQPAEAWLRPTTARALGALRHTH